MKKLLNKMFNPWLSGLQNVFYIGQCMCFVDSPYLTKKTFVFSERFPKAYSFEYGEFVILLKESHNTN